MITHKIFVAFIVIVAVIAGILNIVPGRADVIPLAMFNEFFTAALPILGFGALVKYLCTCSYKCNCGATGCLARCGCGAKSCKECNPK